MDLRFDGLTIIVTGGGTGIGRAIAQAFAAGGGSVVVNYRKSEKEARQTVADIEQAGGQAKAVQADVTQWDDVTRLIDEARVTFGSVDILINNAGGNIATSIQGSTLGFGPVEQDGKGRVGAEG